VSGALDLLVTSFRILPPTLAWRLGGAVGEVFARLPLREPQRCRAHLRRAFPHADDAWIERTARRTFRHAGRMALWSMATLHCDARQLRRRIVVEGVDNFRALMRGGQRGEATIGFTGHFGNWELLSRLGGTFLPLSVVGKRLRSALADRMVQGARMASGARVVYQDAPFGDFVRELRAGRTLAVLADQDIPRLAGCFVPWFGELAHTPSGPAALALLTRAAVQPVFLYEKAGRWVMHVGPRRHFTRSGDTEADVLAITAWAIGYEEALVRRVPHQWVWWHLRWRTRPKKSPEARKSANPQVR
jgi:KDO2-lipid IV(A) lauroyltransferase